MTKRIGSLVLSLSLGLFSSLGLAGEAVEIPVTLEDGRFFGRITFQGVDAQMLLDTGGTTGLYPEFSYYWKTKGSKLGEGDDKHFLRFKHPDSPFTSFPVDTVQGEGIRLIPPDDEESLFGRKVMKDGIIGQGWFGTRVWRFDYKKGKLTLLPVLKNPKGKVTAIDYKEKYFHPKFTVKIDGRDHEMLFDTGATSFFSSEAMKSMGLKSAFSASNFIRESVFAEWKKNHPNWRTIEGGDRFGNQPLIEVPEIEIAGEKVGPVWFARRSNDAYDVFMAESMNCKCSGAIGGGAFRYFKQITVDYPGKKAWFER